MVAALEPDLVVMDINLPGMSGVEATRRLIAEHPDTFVLLVSTYEVNELPRGRGVVGRARVRAQGAPRQSTSSSSSGAIGRYAMWRTA